MEIEGGGEVFISAPQNNASAETAKPIRWHSLLIDERTGSTCTKGKRKKKKGRDLEFRPTELLQPNQSRSFRRQLFFYFFILNSSFLH